MTGRREHGFLRTRVSPRDALHAILILIAVLSGAELVVALCVPQDFALRNPYLTTTLKALATAALATPFAWAFLVRPLDAAIRKEQARIAQSDGVLRAQVERREFESRVTRALEMADDEAAVLETVLRAAHGVLEGRATEVLLAEPGRATLSRAAVDADGEPPGCPALQRSDCIAVREGKALLFPSSGALDACPRLRNRPYGACSALCVPITSLGRAIGVLHTIGPDFQPPHTLQAERLEGLASLSGNRLGMIRALARSQHQASTDGLTGLLNRRALEAATRDLVARGDTYSVLACDLDHFKALNDNHGHEAGDRALRLFSRVLRETVRPTDLAARHGGEEFVAVLPNCAEGAGAGVARRIKEALAREVATALGIPTFTVSIGVAEAKPAEPLREVLARADLALYGAKGAGRNQVMTVSQLPPDTQLEKPRSYDPETPPLDESWHGDIPTARKHGIIPS
jgi:diguanylate cyclase (GGDEF)-like protein